jgi:hypothetical protein
VSNKRVRRGRGEEEENGKKINKSEKEKRWRRIKKKERENNPNSRVYAALNYIDF